MKAGNISIQQKLMRAILLTSGIALLLVFFSYVAYEFFTLRQTTLNQLSTEGKIIATNSTAAIAFESEGDAAEILSALKAEKNVLAACLYDSHGNLFATYSTPSFTGGFPAAQQKEQYTYRENFLEAFIPVSQKNERLGTLYIQLDMRPVYKLIELYAFLAILFGGIVFCFHFICLKDCKKIFQHLFLNWQINQK